MNTEPLSNAPPSSQDRRALVILLQLMQELTDVKPIEESLQAVTDAATALIPGDHASIRLLDSSRKELLVGARSGSGKERPAMSFRLGEGLIGWVVEHQEGILVEDASTDDRFLPDPRTSGFSVRSLLAEPLWSGGNVIGVLSISSPVAGAFTPFHQLLVRLLANCSAPPIERARLRRLALTDDLTLAYNQRYLIPRSQEEVERAKRKSTPLTVLLLDLDHFKRVNDDYGHAIGDQVLRQFADRVRATVRRIDVFVRRSGEEFVLIMPQTEPEHARATAERIRANVGEVPFDLGDGTILTQTVSIGLASWNGAESSEQLMQRADMAMYRAKESGRNRVVEAHAEEIPNPLSLRPEKPS